MKKGISKFRYNQALKKMSRANSDILEISREFKDISQVSVTLGDVSLLIDRAFLYLYEERDDKFLFLKD